MRLTRIAEPGVSSAITSWRDRARYHYISAEEVTTGEESALWRAMNDALAKALQD